MNDILFTIFNDIFYLIILFAAGYLFAKSFYKIYKGEVIFKSIGFHKIENFIYKKAHIDKDKKMNAKQYIVSILLFSLISLVFFILIVMIQEYLFLNPENIKNMDFALAFNTAISFVTNTNWQAYSGETSLSYLSQMLCLTTQNFVSGAVGICVLFALIRGFISKESNNIGNFWVDLVKITLFMIPICFVGSLVLVACGVPQTLNNYVNYVGLEGNSGVLYLGPAASQIIIKQLFTNGGGFYGLNSAYPFENPNYLSNLIESLSLLMIPVSLCFTFGMVLKDNNYKHNHGLTLLVTMTIIFICCLVFTTTAEYMYIIPNDNIISFGNIEGKETRFGIGASSLWAVATTSVSNGSVNCMHDSLTSLGGMVPMFLMMLGEIVYGGVGCGLYGMIAFAILTVFISGLMVGRTPEYLGKKIGSFDVKMVCLVILTPVVLMLLGAGATVLLPNVEEWLTNTGAHGFSEILYTFASLAGNNGSAFAGYNANTVWTNVVGGIIMLVVRFVPMIAVVMLAGSLAKKKIIPQSDGTLNTDNTLFISLLLAVILIVGALSFFPALSLGPIAEFLG